MPMKLLLATSYYSKVLIFLTAKQRSSFSPIKRAALTLKPVKGASNFYFLIVITQVE